MIDIKKIREHPETIIRMLADRNYSFDLAVVADADTKRRTLISETEALKSTLNKNAEEIAQLKKDKKDASALIKNMQDLKKTIQDKDAQLAHVEEMCEKLLLEIPNIPETSVPVGKTEKNNKLLYEKGIKKDPSFKLKDHVEIGKNLHILDFETAAKLSGSRFALLKGDGAALERALIQFMLDLHINEHGYTEILPPLMVNPASMQGTGQLPKFADELFRCKDDELYLIPTAEVPLTGMHQGEILPEKELPIKYVSYTPCFRREAGSYGKDTRGLIRNHQFNKVELVKFVHPDHALQELDALRNDAEEVLQKLQLAYRVTELCTGDLGFASAKTYDLEVWMPAEKRYREVSSCSLFTDFQARRLQIKYRTADTKNKFVHTLNGSGLAVGRIFAAILENYQKQDGSVEIPSVLHSYIGKKKLRNMRNSV
ncbi:MAG: serine--tRNA ligase [bacterium]